MDIVVDYNPTPKQTMYHESEADEMLYGGAAGGGKSKATVMEALKLCLDHPNTKAYCFRKTYAELRDTLIPEAMASYPDGIGKYNEQKHTYFLINGSEIRFRYCRNMKDAQNYKGAEIHWLFFDELTSFLKKVYDFLKTRVRANKALGIKPKIKSTSNPGDVGHGWVKAEFADLEHFKIHEKKVYSPTLKKTKIVKKQYIPAYATDNPHITDDYIFELEQKPEALRKALLNGDWNTFEGQVFTEYRDDSQHYDDRKWTHVINPFEIPKEWKIYRSFDFGYSRPFSFGWWAIDNDGRMYRILELYGCTGEPNVGVKWEPNKIFQKAKEIEDTHRWLKGKRILGVADPSIWDESRGESIATTAEKHRIYSEPGDNTRLPGKMQLHYRFSFDENGIPMLYCFNTCKGFTRTMPTLVYDETHVEDINTSCEDHVYDESRYMAMVNPIAPRVNKKSEPIKDDPLNLHQKHYNQYGFMRA